MKETRFIAQNKEKWQESENLLDESHKDPEKLSNLFIQVVDDLSYSRTYYQNRSVRVYLNRIAREYFTIIYSHQKEKKNTFKNFWLSELPQIVYFCRKPMLISLLVFLLAATIGVFSAIKDPHFTASILGDSYVAMTKENISKGDPMAVYKKGHQVDMFLGITLNNLMVAFRTYVLGVFLSIGTLAILLYNGIMVGCFQYFFIERGLFAESALTIWLHGTLEISSIILAGGAGLTLGSGLIFPGTYSRLQAFQISAIRSLKLMLGITPIFILAALIESFLTRYTETPDFLRLFLIIISAAFIIGYFVIYPWMQARRGFDQPLKETKLAPSLREEIKFDRIKNGAEILKDTFTFYRKHFTPLLSWIAGITLFMTIATAIADDPRFVRNVFGNFWLSIFRDAYDAIATPAPIFILINALATSCVIFCTYTFLDREAKKARQQIQWMALLQTTLIIGCLYYLIYALGGWGLFLAPIVFGFLFLWSFAQLTEHTNLFSAFGTAWRLMSARPSNLFGTQLILILLCYSFLLVSSAPLLYLNTEVLGWNFAESDVWSRHIIDFISVYLKLLTFNLILPVAIIAIALLYFSLREIESAEHLKEMIAGVGSKMLKRTRA